MSLDVGRRLKAWKWACCVILALGFSSRAGAADDPLVEGRAPDPQDTVTGQSELAEGADEEERGLLMRLFDEAGVGDDLDAAGITIGGLVEGSYTWSFSGPPGDLITGRSFDLEHDDPTF